eukprot:CAMPEP_0171082532 /NCGR_PEP_ID=MMETSP0766_2-20121228/17166_1 /TAXON_ID=439317 /ORGANISM="Gambierdiscus australes, Strain CAWD 149" /LENGTH=131 /DNA_ID=CAMNT_0011539903 /DNA_START=156 /DNA_END=551 /DNA_ORIENTATION=-
MSITLTTIYSALFSTHCRTTSMTTSGGNAGLAESDQTTLKVESHQLACDFPVPSAPSRISLPPTSTSSPPPCSMPAACLEEATRSFAESQTTASDSPSRPYQPSPACVLGEHKRNQRTQFGRTDCGKAAGR